MRARLRARLSTRVALEITPAMVLKGQFLERMTTVLSDGLLLEGLFHPGPLPNACLIASPHPVFGGSMDSPVCAELAWAITRRGLSTLRFNYRGVGASQGQGHQPRPDAADELRDVHAVATHLQAGRPGKVHVVGYSFGAWLANHFALLNPQLVETVTLVSPPTLEMPFDFEGLSAVNQRVAILVGTRDRHCDLAALDAVEKLPGITVQRIQEADHFYLRGLAELGRLAAQHVAGAETGTLLELDPGEDDIPLELDR